MTNLHAKTFYGRNNSLIISSPSRNEPFIFLSCINRKKDGIWEQISKGEGKTVKLSIEEIISILEVLNKKSAIWRGYHVFKEKRTEIYVGWEDESREVLIIKLGSYQKKLRFPSTNFMKLLIDHILKEKIEFATSGPRKSKGKGKQLDQDELGLFTENITSRDGLKVVETTHYPLDVEVVEIRAKIKAESPKALLIVINSDREFWIPKSTIHSHYDMQKRDSYQNIMVDQWIIERNKKIES